MDSTSHVSDFCVKELKPMSFFQVAFLAVYIFFSFFFNKVKLNFLKTNINVFFFNIG